MAETHETHQEEEALGKAIDLRLMMRLFRLAVPYKKYVLGSLAVLLLESVVQLAGPLLTAATIDLVLAPKAQRDVASAIVHRSLTWLGLPSEGTAGLGAIALLYLAATVVAFLLTVLMVLWTSQMGQGVMYDLRTRIFGHLQRADVSVYDRTPVGRLMTRLTTDVDALNELFTSGFVSLLGDVAVLGGIVALLFALNASLAAITFGVLLPMFFVTNWFRKGARDTYRDVRTRIARVNAFLQEHLSGAAVVQLFRQERRSLERFAVVNDEHRKANVRSIFAYGGWLVMKGRMSVGAVVAFLQYSKRFYRPLMDLSEKYNILQAAMASSERIFKLLDATPRIATPADPVPVPEPFRGDVVFEGVKFGYNPGEPVLKGIDLHAEPGKTIAFVGATGSGKSTILSLLLRFYDPLSGRILVDGVDVKAFDPVAMRSKFGIVLQDTFLFSGTIAENVSFFDPKMPRERIEKACLEVGLGPLLSRIPDGLDAKLTERGGGLSVGEKQLVSFARALARDPRILILDEATSSVDPETEEKIEEAIKRLLAGRTSLVVAHRLSTIVRADRILVLSHGEIRESGTHAELLERGGIYARLYALQLKDREAAA